MEIRINVSDYLSGEEIKDIVINETRNAVRSNIGEMFIGEENINRILINTAYTSIEMEIEKIIPNYKEIIASEVKDIINKNDLIHQIFAHDYFDNTDTLGLKYIKEAINENKKVIEDKVKSAIENYDPKELIQECFGKKVTELAESFGNVADLLYNIADKD